MVQGAIRELAKIGNVYGGLRWGVILVSAWLANLTCEGELSNLTCEGELSNLTVTCEGELSNLTCDRGLWNANRDMTMGPAICQL